MFNLSSKLNFLEFLSFIYYSHFIFVNLTEIQQQIVIIISVSCLYCSRQNQLSASTRLRVVVLSLQGIVLKVSKN